MSAYRSQNGERIVASGDVQTYYAYDQWKLGVVYNSRASHVGGTKAAQSAIGRAADAARRSPRGGELKDGVHYEARQDGGAVTIVVGWPGNSKESSDEQQSEST